MIPFSLEVGPQNPFLLFLMRERERGKREEREGLVNSIPYHIMSFMQYPTRQEVFVLNKVGTLNS
jgi:hypothetical protein